MAGIGDKRNSCISL